MAQEGQRGTQAGGMIWKRSLSLSAGMIASDLSASMDQKSATQAPADHMVFMECGSGLF
jgi:hypothetical protein